MWRRPEEAPRRRVDQMEGSLIGRDIWKLRKTIDETIKKDLDVNCLIVNMIYDKILWCRLIYVADST